MSLPTPLINRDRAEQVMAQFGVGALVLADPMNVYYATGFWPQTLVMGHIGSTVAVVPADRTKPVVMVTAQFLHYFFDLDAVPAGSPLHILLYTAPDQDGEGALPPFFFRAAADGVPDAHERATRETTTAHLADHPAFASATPRAAGGARRRGRRSRLGRSRRAGAARRRVRPRRSAAATHPDDQVAARRSG